MSVLPVVQHYPLYRLSDAGCTGQDAAPPEERHLLFREKYDVLSKEASQRVSEYSPVQSHRLCYGLSLSPSFSQSASEAFHPIKTQYHCQE